MGPSPPSTQAPPPNTVSPANPTTPPPVGGGKTTPSPTTAGTTAPTPAPATEAPTPAPTIGVTVQVQVAFDLGGNVTGLTAEKQVMAISRQAGTFLGIKPRRRLFQRIFEGLQDNPVNRQMK